MAIEPTKQQELTTRTEYLFWEFVDEAEETISEALDRGAQDGYQIERFTTAAILKEVYIVKIHSFVLSREIEE